MKKLLTTGVLVSSVLAGGWLLAVDAKKPDVLAAIQQCKLAMDMFGDDVKVNWTKTIGTAGLWMPPTPGCYYLSHVNGSRKSANVYYAKDGKACFHTMRHTGKMKRHSDNSQTAIWQVIDLRSCKDVSPGKSPSSFTKKKTP